MKANELRIGNIVYFGIVDEPIRMLSIEPNSPLMDMYKPIPITEEWMLKLGCVKQSGEEDMFKLIYRDKNRQFIIAQYESGQWVYYPEELYGFSIDINYIHQLQNTYFIIQKTELTIKL